MSNGSATFGFLSWLRQGIGTGLTTPDAAALGGPRVALPLGVTVSGVLANEPPVNVNGISLYGPGEIANLDTSAIARLWPLQGTLDAESNYFPIMELVPPDLPWKYTPSAPDTKYQRLRPWMCLLALEDSEYTLEKLSTGMQVLDIGKDTPLPMLSQAWAWAHVQIPGSKTLSSANNADVATVKSANNMVARLICPRRLNASTHYTVFLVPVFARGVQAGLGTPPDDSVDGLAPAWSDADAPSRAGVLRTPAYFAWDFSTGQFGDFEYLVRQLKTGGLPSTVGTRPIDVSGPGAGLPGAAPSLGNVLKLEGALKAPGTESNWTNQDRQAWTGALAALMQQAAPVQSDIPLYGRWHAERDALNSNLDLTKPLPWFDDLNTDPRLRVAAAMGVAVVQAEQQQLMASAWQQGAGIAEVNAELRQAQFGRELSRRLYTRHIMSAAPRDTLRITSPVHPRVKFTTVDCVTNTNATRPVSVWIQGSPAPRGLFDAQWRRVSRAWGGPAAMMSWTVRLSPASSAITEHLLDGTATVAAKPGVPGGMATTPAAGLSQASFYNAVSAPLKGPSNLSPADYYPAGNKDVITPAPPATSDNMGTAWGPFGTAISAVAAAFDLAPQPAPKKCTASPSALAGAMVAALDPTVTMSAAYSGRLQFNQPGTWQGQDSLGPAYIAPTYTQPAFEPLRRLSIEWIFPGLGQVPPNTVSLLESNDRFIEAYLAGMNFELGRELLWNGFPTDQRGSYFRRFWDHSSALTASGQLPDDDARNDIDVMTNWENPLGQNPNPQGLPAGALFLLMRGDLLHRYPNALVYMTKAVIAADGKRAFPDPDASPAPTEKYPVFQISIPRDVSLLAFDLPAEDAIGNTTNPDDSTNPGWYLVLQEHAAETRFGLEAATLADYNKCVTNWMHVNWGSFAADDAGLGKLDYIDLDAAIPDTTQAKNSEDAATTLSWHDGDGSRASDIACITLRDPYRVAIHASSLLGGV
jgi:hypothetical protein